MSRATTLLLAVLLGQCGGCAVGPDYHEPAAPASTSYLPPTTPAGDMPTLAVGREVPAEWWTLFGSPELNRLVDAALAHSPGLDLARARVTQAAELLAARSGATEWPRVDLVAGASRQAIDPATVGFPQAPVPPPFNVFKLGANVSYDFDLFGGQRSEVRSLAAEVDYQAFELQAARLSLAGNVVLAAIRIAALEAQIAALNALLDVQRQQLAINEQRLSMGAVSRLELRNQRTQLSAGEGALPPLRQQLALAENLLAVLGGNEPAQAAAARPALAELSLPHELPLRLPSQLARQRPDIRAREALLRKASANVGVATADLYPKLVISGGFSTSQVQLSDLFGNGINVWNFGANLVQPLLRGDELRARQRAAQAAYEQALAGYRQTVLLGLQNVADVLRSLQADHDALRIQDERLAHAEQVWAISRDRFDIGGISRLTLLDAERQQRQAEFDRVPALASRYADAAALMQALGGGWSMTEPVAVGPR